MSKRLQVLLEPREYKNYQKIARDNGVTLGEWVRQTLRQISSRLSLKKSDEKMRQLRQLSKHSFPSGNIDQILSQIEKGYLE